MSTRRCCVVSDARFARKGGRYWDPRNNFPTGHWQEMLTVFDEVTIFARAAPSADEPSPDVVLPKGVTVREAPYYVGAAALVRNLPALLRSVWRLAGEDCVFLLRGPGLLSMLAALALRLRRRRYCVELLGDSGESLMFSSSRLRVVWAALARAATRAVTRHASAALYVVGFLAERYPAPAGALRQVISDARLFEWMFKPAHRAPLAGPLRLVMVANMEQPYKGHTYLFEALAILRRRGVEVRLRLIGDGRFRARLEELAGALGIADLVEFLGALAWGEPVFAVLDESDLFVLTSLTEGMPKALLEAMARGLPAIATAVGGIPEVLPPGALMPPADAAAIAAKVLQLHEERAALERLAEEARRVAERFRDPALGARRREFYGELLRPSETATYLQ